MTDRLDPTASCDQDVHAKARRLIEEYEAEAVSYVELMVAAAENADDLDDEREWRSILAVVCRLIKQRGRRLH